MAVTSMKQLLEAGVHFGHQTKRWNPKMGKYIYAARNDIHIIDLAISVEKVEEAYKFVKEIASQGKSILFVGTKKQAQDAIKDEAERCGMFYINNRWLGGTLTNFKTIRSSIDRLNKLNQMEIIGDFELLPKKEVANLKKERAKLKANLGGIANMRTLPGALFIVDLKKEEIAVNEARNLNIPIVAVVDTNCDPDLVDYVIPGNDDAIRAIKLFASFIADAVIEAREGVTPTAQTEDIATSEATDEAVEPETAVAAEVKVEEPVQEESVNMTAEEALAKALKEIEDNE